MVLQALQRWRWVEAAEEVAGARVQAVPAGAGWTWRVRGRARAWARRGRRGGWARRAWGWRRGFAWAAASWAPRARRRLSEAGRGEEVAGKKP